jgi:signal transduction histidine kinase/ActR/RegA family two-component response regulator
MPTITLEYLAGVDWSRTAVGPMEAWPVSLKSYVAMILDLPTPAIIFWGPELTQIYNDGYAIILGPRHPRGMGQTYQECWPDTYPLINPWMQQVLGEGKYTEVLRAPITLTRHGFSEEAFFTFTLTPLRDDQGRIAGVYQPVVEMTDSVLRERRAETLRVLTARPETVTQAVAAFTANRADVPLAGIYLHGDGKTLEQVAAIGLADTESFARTLPSLDRVVREVFASNVAVVTAIEPVVTEPWPEPVVRAFVVPLRRSASDPPLGVVALGLSPRLSWDSDDRYRELCESIAREMGSTLASQRAQRVAVEWKEREEAARREAAAAEARRLAILFEHAPVAIAVLRGREHVFEVANAKYAALVGNRPLLGLPLGVALGELAGQGIVELVAGVYRTGEPFYGHGFPTTVVSPLGIAEERYFDFAYEPVPGDDGRPESVIAVVFEVTELSRARREAESANRAKDEFFAILGHELRNPLAPIRTALQLMRLRGDEGLARERTIIERQVEQITRLVDDLLDVSRITGGKVTVKNEPLEMSWVVSKAIEMASPLLEERRHHLEVKVPSRGLAVDGDEARLAQVVANLLTNAAKYTEPGGRVTVTGDTSADGTRVLLRVADNGIGIAPEMLPRVFDAFAQEQQALDRALGGLGLGLTIVANLVKLHGGTARAASEGRGKGSAFVIDLPRSNVAAEALRTPAQGLPPVLPDLARAAAARRTLRVLVVDDNRDAAELLGEALDMLGYEVRLAHDGAEALRLVGEQVPDVALLDIGLPVMDGYELAAQLRGGPSGAKLKLVAVTGYGQESDRKRAIEAGFDAHLVKPVQLDTVATLIARYRDEV